MTEQKQELLACPFCGISPRYLPHKEGFYSERVICDECGFHLPPEAWNRRSIAQAPAGYCIVPVEPTEEMIRAVYPYHWFIASMRGDAIRKYRAMIAAVPQSESKIIPNNIPSAPIADRNAIIEECAMMSQRLSKRSDDMGAIIANVIRALKTAEGEKA